MIDRTQLIAHWKLVSFTEQKPGGEWADALGARAHGSISYSDSGHMQVLIGSPQRPRFRGEWSAIPDADKARCLDLMVAYAGSFSLQDDRVIHHVTTCWIPNWEGRDLVRQASFPAPGQLLLRTVDAAGGRQGPKQAVLWERT